EKQAARHVYEYRLTNNEAPWLILLTPCETVEQATESLKDRYGAERVIAVRRKQITKMETEK
ncbi:MAG TPA: hypothetical protein VK110_05540, partial [Salinisphaeraceae bacterium]|nr:hypothetical protein [Salinisphaeraceae bacterium]